MININDNNKIECRISIYNIRKVRWCARFESKLPLSCMSYTCAYIQKQIEGGWFGYPWMAKSV